MGQRRRNCVVVKDVRSKLRIEESVSSMEQRGNYAVVKDAQIKLRREDYASSMGHNKSLLVCRHKFQLTEMNSQ